MSRLGSILQTILVGIAATLVYVGVVTVVFAAIIVVLPLIVFMEIYEAMRATIKRCMTKLFGSSNGWK